MTQFVLILKGLPGSGKSTFAKEKVRDSNGKVKRVSKDDLRRMLDVGEWSKSNEKFILAARDALILAALAQGHDVVVDDTNLAPKHEAHIRQLVGNKAIVLTNSSFLEVPLEVCIKQDLMRRYSVGKDVIEGMYHQFVEKGARYTSTPPEHVEDAPPAIIVDLDGTLAVIGDRSPYDGVNCRVDTVNESVAQVLTDWLHSYCTNDNRPLPSGHVFFCSGRNEIARAATEAWITEHVVDLDWFGEDITLLMRTDGDSRKDAIVKQELYEQHIKGKFNVQFVLDDRDQVVRMWREQGLPCWQVNYGNF